MMITPDSLKQDFEFSEKFQKKKIVSATSEKESNKRAERLTTVEDDLLYASS